MADTPVPRDPYDAVLAAVQDLRQDVRDLRAELTRRDDAHDACSEKVGGRIAQLELWRAGFNASTATISVIVSALTTGVGLLLAWITGSR